MTLNQTTRDSYTRHPEHAETRACALTSLGRLKGANVLWTDLDVRFINTLPATVGGQHAAPLLPEGYARAQGLRNGHLAHVAYVKK
jgi:hypothetical protein